MMPRIAGIMVVLIGVLLGNSISHTQDVFVFEWMQPTQGSLFDSTGPQLSGFMKRELTQPRSSDAFSSYFSLTTKDLQVPAGVRLIVYSPHPDDESLAAGGLVQRVLEKGGEVRVVFVTNGDGYAEGVRRRLKRTETSSTDFIEYGKRRHDEAVQAICELGLPAKDGIFLGFPDDGIDDLWSTYWSRLKPFTSPHTRFDRALYKDSFSRWVKYAGVDLENEIARTLKDFTPDWVVIPDPRDFHPDHSTTGIFVLGALRRLGQEGEVSFANTQVFTYLVHYKDYPTSAKWLKAIRKAGIGGSPACVNLLSSTQWLNLSLTAEELAGKQRALAAHQTQLEMLGGFFKIYVRPSEIFGRLQPAQILALPQEYAAQFKRSSS